MDIIEANSDTMVNYFIEHDSTTLFAIRADKELITYIKIALMKTLIRNDQNILKSSFKYLKVFQFHTLNMFYGR